MMNVENMEYNTTRNYLVMREYGRHIQKIVDYLLTIEDKEKRQRNAMSLIELMGFLNPHLKNVEDFRHKLWDHLFLISDFKLDVESPYPIPTRETLKAKPEPLGYPKRYPKFNHLGKNIEVVINKALSILKVSPAFTLSRLASITRSRSSGYSVFFQNNESDRNISRG